MKKEGGLMQKKIKKKKGLTTLETCIGGLIFILVFAAILDFIMVSHRYLSLTDTAKEMARIISVQGGSLKTKPAAYSGNYYTSKELGTVFKKQMNDMGFADGEYSLYITYTNVFDDITNDVKEKNSTELILGTDTDGSYKVNPTEKIEYLNDFSLKIIAEYQWPFLGAVTKSRKSFLQVSMPGLSEWRYKYDGWNSERGD